jgi:hypothetical protein
VLQGLEGIRASPMLIFGLLPEKIQAIHRYENVTTHTHPYIDISCPFLLLNTKTNTKILFAGASPLLTN